MAQNCTDHGSPYCRLHPPSVFDMHLLHVGIPWIFHMVFPQLCGQHPHSSTELNVCSRFSTVSRSVRHDSSRGRSKESFSFTVLTHFSTHRSATVAGEMTLKFPSIVATMVFSDPSVPGRLIKIEIIVSFEFYLDIVLF